MPTRRRSDEDFVDADDEEETGRTLKRRQSNGARASAAPLANGHNGRIYSDEDEDLEYSGFRGKGKGKGRADAGTASNEHDDNAMDDDDESFAERVGQMEALARQLVPGDNIDHDHQDEEQEERPDRFAGGSKENSLAATSNGQTKGHAKREPDKGKSKCKDHQGPQAGIVKKISVSNFMCHRKLSISLGKHVNFINGSNGSGKSAILAALQICLGAKASSTHRAKRLSDFIKHGWKGDAILEVTLLNTEQGFKYEEYGDEITIQRKIRAPTGGSFTLIGADGTVMSKDKGELTRMLDIFNIQVDNPCAVLDQENSKKFLQGSEADKYNFFMKATDLDRILADSNQVTMEVAKMSKGFNDAQDQLPKYRKIVTELDAEVKEFDRIEQMEAKIEKLKEELCWAHVAETEAIVDHADNQWKLKVNLTTEIKEKISELDAVLKELSEISHASAETVQEGLAETKRRKALMLEAHNEWKKAKEPLANLAMQKNATTQDLRSKQVAKKSAEREVKAARAKAMLNASGVEEKKLLTLIEQTHGKLQATASHKANLCGDEALARLYAAIPSTREAFDAAKKVLQEKMAEQQSEEQFLRSLSGATSDPLAAFGSNMSSFVKKIKQNAGRFRTLPVGPIGAYVKLKEEWKAFAQPIEVVLGGCLNNFVVTTQQDKTELVKIIKSLQWGREPPPTIVVQHPGARFTPSETPLECLQVMQAITVSNNLVFNVLVDQASIEKEALFSTKEEAERFCLIGRSGSYQPMPYRLKGALYLVRGNQCSRFNVVNGNQQTRKNVANSRQRRVLGVDQGTQLADARERHKNATRMMEEARTAADTAKRHANATELKYSEAKKKSDVLERQERRLMTEKDHLNRKLQMLKTRAQENDPLQDLERKVDGLREEVESLETELVVFEQSIEETAAQVKPYELARQAADKALKDSVAKNDQISRKKEENDAKEYELNRKKARAEGALKKAEAEAAEFLKVKETEEQELATNVSKAQTFVRNLHQKKGSEWDGIRIRHRYGVTAYHNRIEVLMKRKAEEVNKQNLSAKSRDEVEEMLLNATRLFKEKALLAQTLKENIAILLEENRQRVSKWKGMKRYIERRTTMLFNQYLQKKGSAGEVRFNDEEKKLGLTYQKSNTDETSQCNDVKQLSGGERSFATLALLLALGSQHECPFRVMDEFDVFMDAMSRNIAIKSVIEFAAEFDKRQFIFITPQDLSSVQANTSIKIHKMLPPQKGDHNQSTLEEAFANNNS